MSVDHNVALAYRVVEEIWNGGDLGVADVLFAPAYVDHGGLIPDLVRGPEAIKISVALYRTAFPDLHIIVEHAIAEKDLVVLRWTARSRARGELTGVAATERRGALTGMTLCRLAGGKIAESWTNWNTAGVLSRLEMTAPEGQALW
jgi:SnoaL-like polyketide cyclase